MKKIQILKFSLLGFICLGLIVLGMSMVQAQVKIQVKPDGPPGLDKKPPEVICDGDLICENGEYANTLPHELQLCPDCLPKPYGPLDITQDPGVQIFGKWTENGKLFQFKYNEEFGVYEDTWSSVLLADYINEREFFYYNIGDPDGDGDKDIVILKNYLVSEEKIGKGRDKAVIRYYEQEVSIYESGSDGNPTYGTPRFGSSEGYSGVYMADANNNGFKDELILNKGCNDDSYIHNGGYIQIFRMNEDKEFVKLWTSDSYDSAGLQPVGDADGDGDNEILMRSFYGGYAIIIEYMGVNGEGEESWGDVRFSDPIPDCRLDKVLAVEADNYSTPDPEIIGGGNTGQFAVWKFINDQYKLVFLSEPMGIIGEGYIADVEVGDIDGDLNKEVIFSYKEYAWQTPKLYVYDLVWNGSDYELIPVTEKVLARSGSRFAIGDIDGDGKDEIVVTGDGGTVYDFENGVLSETYNALFIGNAKIK